MTAEGSVPPVLASHSPPLAQHQGGVSAANMA